MFGILKQICQSFILANAFFFCGKKVEKNSSNLDEGQQRVVATFLRSARHGGVGLKGKDSERFNVLQLKLAELTNKFR